MSNSKRKIAIITGASSGLGEVYAVEMARRAASLNPKIDELWIVARRQDRLDQLKKSLAPFPVEVIVGDLNQESTMTSITKKLQEGDHTITWLVNNAGFGLIGAFEKLDRSRQLEMIDLNVRALTDLSFRTLPFMEAGSRMLLVASSAGFFPLPNFAVYAATKAYVVSFANALANELLERKISVTAVCPGPVATEFFKVSSGKENDKLPFQMAKPLDVVGKSLLDAQKSRLRSTYGWLFQLSILLSGITPRALLKTRLAGFIKKATDA